MYCEILQYQHTERKLESVVTPETHRHTGLFYNYLAVRDKGMYRRYSECFEYLYISKEILCEFINIYE